MTRPPIAADEQHLLDLCSKYLARDQTEDRHDFFGRLPATSRKVSEAWRFPAIETHHHAEAHQDGRWNEVTFAVIAPPAGSAIFSAAVRGTFAPLYEVYPLAQVADTRFHALTLLLPAGQCFRYRYLINGVEGPDPVNPQRTTADNGAVWSQFFTDACFEAITFERWERVILDRLTRHILPFNTAEAREFMSRMSEEARRDHPFLHRFDLSIGVVNFLDKLLAREERHRLEDYKICLSLCDSILRSRNPYLEPRDMPEGMFIDLYAQLRSGSVPGWAYSRYGSPAFFLQMLRRHTVTAAFSHPRYGGNAGGSAWQYLSEKYRDAQSQTIFDWRRALERPLGTSTEYHG